MAARLAVGDANAAHAAGTGQSPERVAFDAALRLPVKRLLRAAFDHLQADCAAALLLASPPVPRPARRVRFGAADAPSTPGQGQTKAALTRHRRCGQESQKQ